jgi:hypothetical protein
VRDVSRGFVEAVGVATGSCGLVALLLYPLSVHVGTLARTDNADAQFSIWNVAWVAHALATDPRHVLDANIFYPHQRTLVYSEANLAAGVLGAPAYWLTRNPYVAHNVVVLLAFALSAIAMYYLVRYLVGDRRAATMAAICFAFAPSVFAHLSHIQLLMNAGIPFSLLAMHRMADRPSPRRAVMLGASMAIEAYACAYYAVFLMLTVGLGVVVIAVSRRLWRSPAYLIAVAIAAAVAIALALPLAIQYVALQRTTGFSRTLMDARSYSADWRAYLASPAYVHAWVLALIHRWKDVLFPGFAVTICAGIGIVQGLKSGRRRELVLFYGLLAVLAGWASFGPDAGLYAVLFRTVPGFTFLRGASRFGLIVGFAVCVLAAQGVSDLLARVRHPAMIFSLLLVAAIAESTAHLGFAPAPPVVPAYRLLAHLPSGAVLELPVYSRRFAFLRARYMLASTAHWHPLVDGYSDYTPDDFFEAQDDLGQFPTAASLDWVKQHGVRYAVYHLDHYESAERLILLKRLKAFAPYLRQLYGDDDIRVFEIVAGP